MNQTVNIAIRIDNLNHGTKIKENGTKAYNVVIHTLIIALLDVKIIPKAIGSNLVPRLL